MATTTFRKEYFKALRKRMACNNYDEYRHLVELAKEKQHFLNFKRLTQQQFDTLVKKAEALAASEEFVYNPLKQLIVDKKDYNSLSSAGKLRYMLELSDLYQFILDEKINRKK